MAKFYGMIGYATTVEQNPDVWVEMITERPHTGDILRDTRQNQNGSQVNDNVLLANRFSIVADGFANQNIPNMKYIKWMGVSWKISSVEVQRPRLILVTGGVYNGPGPTV